MRTVSVIGFDGALASAITGVIDLFRLAGVTWARINDTPPEQQFTTQLLTEGGRPCRCINGITLMADGDWRDIPTGNSQADLVIVPTIGAPIAQVLEANPGMIDWLGGFQEAPTGQVRLASNCTGAFLLAEAGLLDGRQATTHWGFSNQFRKRFPGVDLQPDKLITVDGHIACAGGGMAWWDLGVYLVERYAGAKVARELAKAFVIDAGRTSQAPYGALQARRYHSDAAILKLQDWLDVNHTRPVTLQALAAFAGLTERSLIRRFKAATGDTPTGYLQILRIEAARQHLENSRVAVEVVTRLVGYEDVSSFSRLFRKHTGLAPGIYRARFGR
ncbi:GlxA family transcriptional regulator [Marinobacter sp.]|jgi:transcriptional regulator GlxA family with amidase domain|uniref:GlxA family transcriptional regulator n=1 Tax=Marinobacter sp. TaxID=50741 RepID=UPI000C56ED57|nr:helix-turn-helix domain-containing protein [Marinobacter sp.]MBP54679.1 AraC family transcriptional regulator [Marinobacter sp.]|tara:strand:- start:166 stop:1161 length:996 start_codon:yes stop_codon:yes gene_type:complete